MNIKDLPLLDEKPEPKCSKCDKDIEPIKTPTGKYLSFQPTICDDCLYKEKNEKEFEQIKLRKNNIRKIATERNLPAKFAKEVMEDHYKEDFHYRIVERFIKQQESFLILGNPESGKSHFAGWVFMQALNRYPLISSDQFYYTSLLEIDELVRKEWKETEILSLCKVPYLFFQFGDIARERMRGDGVTSFIDTLFFKIVNYRYEIKPLPTIWITRLNIGAQAMKIYDEATITRIIENSIRLQFKDYKHRFKKAKKTESYNL